MSANQKHIVLINAIYPPDKGASGLAAFELVHSLKDFGHHLTVLTTDRIYHSSEEEQRTSERVIRVSSKGKSQNPLKRLWNAYYEAKSLLKKAASLNADAYIICTDPPLLNYLLPKYLPNRKCFIWAMDLYPDAFVAKGLVKESSYLNQRYWQKLRKELNSNIQFISLGEKQKDYISLKYQKNIQAPYIIPCGVKNIPSAHDAAEWKTDDKLYIGYCGNIGEAHCADFLIQLISKADPARFQFMLSMIGAKKDQVITAVKNYPHVTEVEWISEAEMHNLDIQIVTLLDSWTHICVPSKAVSAICSGIPLIFHGSSDGDTFHHFQEALWHIDCTREISDQIEEMYQSLDKSEVKKKKENALLCAQEIRSIYDTGVNILNQKLSE